MTAVSSPDSRSVLPTGTSRSDSSVAAGLLLLITLAAMAPLLIDVSGIRVYTPYIPFSVALLLSFGLWLLRMDSLVMRREDLALTLLTLLCMTSAAMALDVAKGYSGAVVMLYALGVYFMVRYWLRIGVVSREKLFAVFATAFVILTAVAVLQLVLQSNAGVVSTYFGESSAGGSYANAGGRLRVSGTLGNANVFAQVYSIYGTVMVAGLLFSRMRGRALYALMVSAILMGIEIASLSRSGLFGAVLMQSLIYGFWITRDRRAAPERFLLVAIPAVVGLAVVALLFLQNAQGSGALARFQDPADGGRMALAEGALVLLTEPRTALFGVGAGQFFQGIAHFEIPLSYKAWRNMGDIGSSVHNWPLQVGTEFGLVVLALYVYALARTISRGWSARRSERGWLPASLALVTAALYLVPLQFTTAGLTPWILTPVAVLLAWIQYECDEATPYVE